MIKCVSRRVIVVEAPEQTDFERAVLILRSGAPGPDSRDCAPILKEACRIANRCAKRYAPRRRRALPPPVWALLGAAVGVSLCLPAIF